MKTPVAFEDAHVRLERLSPAHAPALLAAANADRSTYDLATVPRDEVGMHAYIESALADPAGIPFAVIRKKGSPSVVGSMRFMNMEWWKWSGGAIQVEGEPRDRNAGDPPDAVEIGHVWLARSAQRTAINSSACFLLMCHAFEQWRVHRLVLKTDARNARSRAAITRLGAHFEGILRQHLPAADGTIRDTAMFSIIPPEWPDVKRRLGEAAGVSP